MNAEQIIVDHREYYFNADTLEDPNVIRVFLFEDPQLEQVAKTEDGKTRMVQKETIHENINEFGGGGAGYAVWGGNRGGFGNPGGGRFSGRGTGFGQSSNNNGGSNLMYTYSIEPLNQTLQQEPNIQDVGEYIHVGSAIKGKVLGKDKWIEDIKVLSIEEDSDNNTSAYVCLDPETSQPIKIDPTSAELIKKELSPEMIVRDVVGENYYPRIGEFLNERIDFERGEEPLKSLRIGKKRFPKLSEDEIYEIVDQHFEDAEQSVFSTYPEMKYTHKQYDEAFNNYIRQQVPELANDKRNFYTIYCKFGPQ